jgi:hypothetical protein
LLLESLKTPDRGAHLRTLADPKALFTDPQPPFPDLLLTRIAAPSSLTMGNEMDGGEAEMATERKEDTRRNWWIGTFWFAGIALFVVELGVGLDYVHAQLAALAPNFLGEVPVASLAVWKLAESAIWNCGQLEATFRTIPFATLPFLLLGIAFSMKQNMAFGRERNTSR